MPKDDWLRLAILYDENAKYSPSNNSAIDRFCESAVFNKIYPTIIKNTDGVDILHSFDGLFIRNTSHPSNPTFEFALEAERLGIKVVDNSTAILQGCNKIWQWEQFTKHKIPHPKTCVIDKNKRYIDFTFPCILKIPDSCFSQGVFKARDKVEFDYLLHHISSPKVVCQEFIETKFDWRITIFDNQFLFAVKYFMVQDDWKIIKYDRKGNYIDGNHECVAIADVPSHVLALAAKCNKFITNGLYGIDIKQVDDRAYVIEINDNANIDAGIEDGIEGDKIYDTIIRWFRG